MVAYNASMESRRVIRGSDQHINHDRDRMPTPWFFYSFFLLGRSTRNANTDDDNDRNRDSGSDNSWQTCRQFRFSWFV